MKRWRWHRFVVERVGMLTPAFGFAAAHLSHLVLPVLYFVLFVLLFCNDGLAAQVYYCQTPLYIRASMVNHRIPNHGGDAHHQSSHRHRRKRGRIAGVQVKLRWLWKPSEVIINWRKLLLLNLTLVYPATYLPLPTVTNVSLRWSLDAPWCKRMICVATIGSHFWFSYRIITSWLRGSGSGWLSIDQPRSGSPLTFQTGVTVHNCVSSTETLSCGFPQGSVLGPGICSHCIFVPSSR